MNNPSFKYRLIIGLSFFLILGLFDLKKNPKRLKEYLFLFSITELTMLYGIVHDFITYTISPNYYILGKDIESATQGFNIDVIAIALKATWTVGLIIGVTFLFANNPKKNQSQLCYKKLYRYLYIPFITSIVTAIIFGSIYYINDRKIRLTFEEMLSIQEYKQFIATWGIHIGSYVGGFLGLIIAIIKIIKDRKRSGELCD